MSSMTKLRRRALRWHRYGRKVGWNVQWWRSGGQLRNAAAMQREQNRRRWLAEQRWWADQ